MKLRTFGYMVMLTAVLMLTGFGMARTHALHDVGASLLLVGLCVALGTCVTDLLLYNRRKRWHFR